MLNRPKLLIIGPARHGKDTVGEILSEQGFRCLASSEFATTRIMMPYFHSAGVHYPNAAACFEDRVNHRATWYDQIEIYNSPEWNRVTKEMFEDGFDVYLGMRSRKEFEASRPLFDRVFWVDGSHRLPPEDISSNTLTAEDADEIIDNNGTLDDLHRIVTGIVLRYKRTEALERSKELSTLVLEHTAHIARLEYVLSESQKTNRELNAARNANEQTIAELRSEVSSLRTFLDDRGLLQHF